MDLIKSNFIGSDNIYLVTYRYVLNTFFIRVPYTIIIYIIKNITTNNGWFCLGIRIKEKEIRKVKEMKTDRIRSLVVSKFMI